MEDTAIPAFGAVLADWQPFFVAQLGAGAALLGLLFVGLSLNLERILAYPALPLRAEIGLLLLALQITLCSVLLIPNQGAGAAGLAVLALATGLWLVTTLLSIRVLRLGGEGKSRGWLNLAFLQAATLPYIAGGLMILAGAPAALNAIALGIILSFLKAGLDAWVLLVEINR